ncbi:hypothetical protein [Fluviicola sp.]|uniref:hypothetical protein n=1 Tax=Fluviicola sp. TaxID=1917219 RepID=UPI0031D2F090
MTLKEITILIADWSDYMILPVFAVSLFTVRRNNYFTILSAYLFCLAPWMIASKITADHKIANYYLYHIIGLVELIFTFLLYLSLDLKKYWNIIFGIVLVAYLVDSGYLLVHNREEINSVGLACCMFFMMALGFNFIWKLYQEEKVEYLGFYPHFYISGGLTVFASGAFFGYLLIARMTHEIVPEENFDYSWIIISGFTYIKFILIVLGIFVERKYAK